ncbi:753_t:CDS:1 [Racocetra fulgida]|uniref:753_t:CDS:1 n=1 Tax=Racocetra fulgida TaxID=60492 RepID=A0A9N9F0B3_9GLOM|nr:753_t:CDS:1 [Racocetra fulgida]
MWPEILIGNDDLRSIVKNGSLNNINFEILANTQMRIFLPDRLTQEELTLTRGNINTLLKLLEGKIDGTDISSISSRAWTIAKGTQHEKYINVFEKLRDEYKTEFPDQKYHNKRPRWIHKNACDYVNKDSSSLQNFVPAPTPTVQDPITIDDQFSFFSPTNENVLSEVLFQGERTQVNNLPIENMMSITHQGYVPVWPTEQLPTFHEPIIGEDQYF